MKKQTNEIALIKKSIPNTLLADIQSLKIIDTKTLTEATEKLSQVNKYLDSVIEWREKKTKPLNALLKTIRGETKPMEEMLEQAVKFIRLLMGTYATNIEIEKSKIADRIRAGKGNLSVEKGLEKIEAIAVPETVETSSGSLKFRPHQQLKITNLARIPRTFMVVDERKLLEALKRGDEVEGAEIEVVQIPINNRN